MTQLDRPSIVMNENLAEKIGELLCNALYGDLSRQKPLSVTDKESYWRVEGNWNREGVMEGLAEFFMSIDKSDGRITDIGELMRYAPHPSVIPIINEHLTRKGTIEGTARTELDHEYSDTNQADPEASASGMMLLINLSRGGVVFSGDLAIKIGELLCEAHYGDLSRQMPLTVADKNTYWRVEGNWNRDGKVKGPGLFFVSINKYDGRVTEISE
jgi:hypothetical protein